MKIIIMIIMLSLIKVIAIQRLRSRSPVFARFVFFISLDCLLIVLTSERKERWIDTKLNSFKLLFLSLSLTLWFFFSSCIASYFLLIPWTLNKIYCLIWDYLYSSSFSSSLAIVVFIIVVVVVLLPICHHIRARKQ